MAPRVGIVDFGAGNLQSVAHALEAVGAEPFLVSSPAELDRADRAVLPGVGELKTCMTKLCERQLDGALAEYLKVRPLLAVCVGMQLLADGSDEGGGSTALGVIGGRSRKFPGGDRESDGRKRKVPHMGWTPVQQHSHPLWQGIADGSRFYFVHSYYLPPDSFDSNRAQVAGQASHGVEFTAALASGKVFATQFHPEKSGTDGLRMYANFLEWSP